MSAASRVEDSAWPHHARRFFVVSPHLDDAVLGCGTLIARQPGAVVCTVFAGEPAQPLRTQWDEKSGFADSCEAMRARRLEDLHALALCNAEPLQLAFLDAQYGSTPSADDIADALAAQIARFPDCLPVFPFGLWHPDHELVGVACRALLRSRRVRRCIAYEDVIHRTMPNALRAGFARFEREQIRAFACRLDMPRELVSLKRRAVRAYGSQMRAFDPFPPDVERAERYWRLQCA